MIVLAAIPPCRGLGQSVTKVMGGGGGGREGAGVKPTLWLHSAVPPSY